MKNFIKFRGLILLIVFTSMYQNRAIAQTFSANIQVMYDNANHCDGYGIYLLATPDDNSQYTYQWTCPNGNCPNMWVENGSSASFFPNFNQPTTGVYTILITETATGDTASASVSISTYPNPDVYYSANQSGCEGQQVYIHAYGGLPADGPYTYQWGGAGGTPSTSDSTQFTFGPSFSFAPDVIITNGYGCSAQNMSAFWMFGSPTPIANITASGPVTFCTLDSVRLVAEGTHNFYTLQNVTYQWRKYQNNVNDIDSVYYAKSTGRYRCIIAASGCADTSNYIDVVANPLPVVTVNPNGQAGYCIGQPVTLAATSATATSFSWKRNSITINGQTNDSLIVSAPGRYKAVVHDANGCSRASSAVQVFGPPNNQVTVTGSLTFCNGDSVIFTAAPGYTYEWRRNNIPVALPAGAAQSYTAKTQGNYKVMVTNTFNCTVASAPKWVSVPCRLANPEVGELDWEIFPNPFQDNLRIRSPYFLESTCMVALYDLSGRLVQESEIMATDDSEIELFTGDLQSGMYLLQISNGEEVIKQVVVKQ